MGRCPVAATVKRKGEPGRTPKIRAPLMRGVAGALGVSTRAASANRGGVFATRDWPRAATKRKMAVRGKSRSGFMGDRACSGTMKHEGPPFLLDRHQDEKNRPG